MFIMAGHGGMHAHLVLEKEPRVLYLDLQVAKATMCYTGCSLSLLSQWHFPQQDHTYPNQATSPNSAMPCELMGATFFQTTTVLNTLCIKGPSPQTLLFLFHGL